MLLQKTMYITYQHSEPEQENIALNNNSAKPKTLYTIHNKANNIVKSEGHHNSRGITSNIISSSYGEHNQSINTDWFNVWRGSSRGRGTSPITKPIKNWQQFKKKKLFMVGKLWWYTFKQTAWVSWLQSHGNLSIQPDAFLSACLLYTTKKYWVHILAWTVLIPLTPPWHFTSEA